MKLNIKQIQLLDAILQELNLRHSYTSSKLNLVIKFNNSLLKGSFVNFQNSNLITQRILEDFFQDYRIKTNSISFYTLMSKCNCDFNEFKYKDINLNNMHILLSDLLSTVTKLDVSKIDFEPCLYNAVNLETNFKIPFLYFDYDSEFEVVSIVESPKDECTHS